MLEMIWDMWIRSQKTVPGYDDRVGKAFMNYLFMGAEIILSVVIVFNGWGQTRVTLADRALVNSIDVLLLV